MVYEDARDLPHTIAIVVPVYQGEHTLDVLVKEVAPLTETCTTPAGRAMRVSEVLLVHDNGPDGSEDVIRRLSTSTPWVRPVWLSRNFGQHAATIAGMSATGAEWIVTMDEDLQFSPADIGVMLDHAIEHDLQLVYGKSSNTPPHGMLRNTASRIAKTTAQLLLGDAHFTTFSSFRLMLGEVGRGVAAYVGPGVYLDVALSWVFGRSATCPVQFQNGIGRSSGYSTRKLFAHFWQLIITAGPRPLRLVSLLGLASSVAGIAVAIFLLVERLLGNIKLAGWTSLAVIVLLLGGATLFALGIIAEYVGSAVRMAMGKPLYLVTSDPCTGPLRREPQNDRTQVDDG